MEKTPLQEVESPPKYITEMPREGTIAWSEVKESVRDTCEEVLIRIQTRIRNRRLHLHPFFRNYDKLKSGHCRCNQANQVFLTNGILLTKEELDSLKYRYGNELGFNYMKFLADADPAEYGIPKLNEPASIAVECHKASNPVIDFKSEETMVRILSKAKQQAIVNNVPIMDFLSDYDRHKEGEILEVDFRRAVDNANIKMDVEEMDAICKL